MLTPGLDRVRPFNLGLEYCRWYAHAVVIGAGPCIRRRVLSVFHHVAHPLPQVSGHHVKRELAVFFNHALVTKAQPVNSCTSFLTVDMTDIAHGAQILTAKTFAKRIRTCLKRAF